MAEHPAADLELPSANQLRSWGIEPRWSRVIDVPSHRGGSHRWHVLDSDAGLPSSSSSESPAVTLLCVHGNPTWAALWQPFFKRLVSNGDKRRVRVIAVDQLSMGWSERTGPRDYAARVDDLADVVNTLGPFDSPLVVAAHDWGGAISMGWAVHHAAPEHRLTGMVLCNTGIAVPAGRAAPSIIRLAASGPIRDLVCRRTRGFVDGAFRLSGNRVPPALRDALRAPYRTASRRRAIADFVADVPLQPGHPSETALDTVAGRLGEIAVPVLLAWGAKDVVFDDDFAADLADRFPDVRRQRFARAGHLAPLEVDVASAVDRFLDEVLETTSESGVAEPGVAERGTADSGAPADPASATAEPTLWAPIDDADPAAAAFVSGDGATLSWSELSARTKRVAAELRAKGLQPGDRVAILTPPGVDLPVAVYGVWRAGGVTVIADRGLGLRGLGGALRSARPSFVVGPSAALKAARVGRWAPRAVGIDIVVAEPPSTGEPTEAFVPTPDSPAAVLFTSGATGPAKGVRYTHAQLCAQREALRTIYGITPDDRLVAAFAPFALYGPTLGITTALPAVDVTKPATLTASDLEATCARVQATMVFASPSALANVVRTAGTGGSVTDAIRAVRLVLSAGAPIAAELLRAVAELAPRAELHTPYGMTEVLPVADTELAAIEAADASAPDGGVCVGVPAPNVEVRIEPVAESAVRGGFGEIVVRAPWVSDGYLDLWDVEQAARPGGRWHRTGDVGHLDAEGRLWVEGRLAHTIWTSNGPLGPVSVERVAERVTGAQRSAAVGIGPEGTQSVAVVLELPALAAETDGAVAPADVAIDVRRAVHDVVGVDVAAVLVVAALPVDIRHNAKVDRANVARWAAQMLAGERVAPLVRPAMRDRMRR